MMQDLQAIGIIIIVVPAFNFMIFFHELGHFLAGKWRGAYIDRFQIWFGRPIFKKKIGQTTFGIGWIPAGGFVSLPQMESMESIEGEAQKPDALPPLKPLDKVIIAAAGPLFSLLLAYLCALVVWEVGKPVGEVDGTQVGYVMPDSPAQRAGIRAGDIIRAIDGKEVTKWTGNMEGVRELIALSEHETIEFRISRPGEPEDVTLRSSFILPETNWWQRQAMRTVGVLPAMPSVVGAVLPGSPADSAGIQPGWKITRLNGDPVYSPIALQKASATGQPLQLRLEPPPGSAEQACEFTVTPTIPRNWQGKEGAVPIMGISWANPLGSVQMEYPDPQAQVNQSLKWMWDTLKKLFAPGSSVKVEHLSGPVGIVSYVYKMMQASDGIGWRLALWFAVVLNVNLAVLNILPLPVVDGGHVTLGILEMICRRPVSGRFLDWIMTAFVLLLIGFFFFITFKDVGDMIGTPESPPEKLPNPEF